MTDDCRGDGIESDTVIQNIIQWARGREDIRAVLLTSTRAVPGGKVDFFSDYDVIMIVTDIYPYFKQNSWLEDFGDVLVYYRDPIKLVFGLEKFAYITQYMDGCKLDFTLWPVGIIHGVIKTEQLPEDLDVGYTVLIDKDHITDELMPPSYKAFIPDPPKESEYLSLIQEFFHEATYVAKHLWRNELIPAKYNLDYRMKHVNLVKMLQWRMETDHNWSLKLGAYGKGLKDHLKPGIWTALGQSYVGVNIEENWQALFRTIDLFRRVAIEVADELCYEYPNELDGRVMVYLRKVENMDREERLNDIKGVGL